MINDSLGHSIGDKLLQSVASRLGYCVRLSDTVSRLGGDEFVVLLSEVAQAEDAALTARRILRYKKFTISIITNCTRAPASGSAFTPTMA